MKERPIIFNDAMVRAILDGRKTQTRRVMRCPPKRDSGGDLYFDSRLCPYGKPGDRLWVREACADEHPLAIQQGRYSKPGRAGIPGPPPVNYRTIYRADGGEPMQIWRSADRQEYPYFTLNGPANEVDAKYPTVVSNYVRGGKGVYWTRSIHMPHRASRITLEITGVRVERLQDIGEEDAKAEGVQMECDEEGRRCWVDYMWPGTRITLSAADSFASLWQSIYGAESWQSNPWVWVVEFRRLP